MNFANHWERVQRDLAEFPKFGMAMDRLCLYLDGKRFSEMRSGTIGFTNGEAAKRPAFACWIAFDVSETTVCLSDPQAHDQISHKCTVKDEIVLKTFGANSQTDNDNVTIKMAVSSPDEPLRPCIKGLRPGPIDETLLSTFSRK
jgi:hypothetical protein